MVVLCGLATIDERKSEIKEVLEWGVNDELEQDRKGKQEQEQEWEQESAREVLPVLTKLALNLK